MYMMDRNNNREAVSPSMNTPSLFAKLQFHQLADITRNKKGAINFLHIVTIGQPGGATLTQSLRSFHSAYVCSLMRSSLSQLASLSSRPVEVCRILCMVKTHLKTTKHSDSKKRHHEKVLHERDIAHAL